MKYIILNFAYGTGPYLRTTELALAFNDELEKRGDQCLGIVVPWVYGEKQKKIMLEEFLKYADEIFLDEELGKILKSIFYGEKSYEEALARWSESAVNVSREAKKHLSGRFKTISLSGKPHEIDGRNIVLELNRSPRIRYDVAPSYFTTFGYVAEILSSVREVPQEKVAVRRDLLESGIQTANWVEANQKMHAVAFPATFSWQDDYETHFATEILTPPILRLYQPNNDEIDQGIFVTITGIPGLERLYKDAGRLGLKLYSNDTKAVPNSVEALPHIIPNENIVFQFARSGWGSVWLSMISGTPLVVPDFDPKDDPEIYFNNLAIENLGIGVVYRGQKLEEIIERREELKMKCKNLCNKIIDRWGTLDGNQYCAKIFVEDYLNAHT